MEQIIQNLGSGETSLVDVPAPNYDAQQCLIRTSISLISAGTEKMLVDFSKAGFISKAKQQPDKVRQVFDKVKTDGLLATIEAVRSKLDQPLPLGYCNVGRIHAIGCEVAGFAPNDRVVSNGYHAEVVTVSKNLCAKIPDNVSDEAASFTVVGAIALQGIRLAQPTLGETFVVTGLGLVGQMAVQLLLANGCAVIGLDYDADRCELAASFGAKVINLTKDADPVATVARLNPQGIDGAILTAATSSNEPIHQAAQMCRKRGRIVLIGVTGMQMSRDDFYKKELSFQVSCSYGPGRYETDYEKAGHDYPLGFVRWTEQRNFTAVLQLMAAGKLDPLPLISHRFILAKAQDAYALLANKQPSLGILLQYPAESTAALKREVTITPHTQQEAIVSIGFIGAGNYASRILIPAFKQTAAQLISVASTQGMSSIDVAKKQSIHSATTDTDSLIKNTNINTIVIATPHYSHAELAVKALDAGKHIFVEKPLAITLQQLQLICDAYKNATTSVMVGFNRRFSPFIQKAKSLLETIKQPKNMLITVNAGHVAYDHWIQDLKIGGGRVIGECCHFIDLLRFLADAPIVSWQAQMMQEHAAAPKTDNVTLTLTFADGSIGTVHYFANGHRAYHKERLQIFCAGKILSLDNFRQLNGYGWTGFKKMKSWRQDKGQQACAKAFVNAISLGQPAPICFEQLKEVSRVTIEISDFLVG